MSSHAHFFIDFENVRPTAEEFSKVPRSNADVWVMHGAHQNDFPAALVRAWLPLGERMQLVQSTKTGENAVDMLLALCLGEVRQKDLQANRPSRFLIVSNDKDFNALFGHLQLKGTQVDRTPSLAKALELITSVPKSKPAEAAPATNPSDDVEAVIKTLRSNSRSRPKKRSTLERSIESFLGGRATAEESRKIVGALEKKGSISFAGVKVVYHLNK